MINYELRTYDRQLFGLTNEDAQRIEAALKAGKKMVSIRDNIVGTSNIASITKIKRTEADKIDYSHALPQGERKFDPNGPGYKKFLAAKAKLNKKMELK